MDSNLINNSLSSLKPLTPLILSNQILNTQISGTKVSFDETIPKDFNKEKKMSLLIAVLLDIIFGNSDSGKEKLNIIYKYLGNKKILDLDIISDEYSEIRNNLTFLIESLNDKSMSKNDSTYLTNINNLNKITNQTNQTDQTNLSINPGLTNYINKYRNNFNELNQIGYGAYGSVYKVFHKFEKKFYAIKKVFLTEDLIKEEYNIFNEIQLFSSFDNPNILKYNTSWIDIDISSIVEHNITYDYYDNSPINNICPILFIQMELCEFTLKEYIQSYMLTDCVKQRIEYFKQIINGIKYLHTNHIIHRDIKPANIFFCQNKSTNLANAYTVKIGDFGISKNLKNHIDEKYYDFSSCEQNDYQKQLDSYNIDKNSDIDIEHEYFNDIKSYSSESNSDSDSDSDFVSNNQDEISELSYIEDQCMEIRYLTSNIGTGIYSAPETKTNSYDILIDIYSLGIILIELLLNCQTDYEKFKIFENIKKDSNYLFIAYKNNQMITDKYNYLISKMICKCDIRLNIYEVIKLLN